MPCADKINRVKESKMKMVREMTAGETKLLEAGENL